MDVDIKRLAEKEASFFTVFSNPKRVLILWNLKDQEKTVSEIASVVGTSLQNTSQHLRLMKETGILESRRDAQKVFYHIADENLADLCFHVLQVFRTRDGNADLS